ncbi:NAD(P)/FAD-dependent oxidoreductase [Pseudomaricurvus sp. HS19]|uniref:NAD(P)/FAD-dependent oxidoreductase n=1 Tax=Pseudomaricurvus sp. HS19 TaxID=2692626 RepID=UPI00136C4376|nr:NAD(P)/FAD-dependent oxidoreductase [Pseudomaricurvus sp. HS19]MYM61888.1 FAD-dependent oxidoreductase [Pseudomaricurvus sp. HS19]
MSVRILIVGGGAGGLPLATRLGKRLGKKGLADITMVDSGSVHVWKPRFHEVATGAIDSDLDAVDYRAHARLNHYSFELGTLTAVDRAEKRITLAPILSSSGDTVLPERSLDYDILVLSIGSHGNDFGTPGVREHCLFLDSREQADRFHERFLNTCMAANYSSAVIEIAIVGAGATGVELAAEIHHAVDMLKLYGHQHLDRSKLRVHLIEASPRILPPLNESIAKAAHTQLEAMGVIVHTGTMVKEATAEGFVTSEGEVIAAELLVWAAGIKAPEILTTLGLETNRVNQLVVSQELRTTDPYIFAFGDCCACPDGHGKNVPPRAQSAQQMAITLARNLEHLIGMKPLQPFVYRDRGSLVSLSSFTSVGNLMGNLRGSNFFVEGWLARMMYISLYRLHQAALYGWPRTLMLLLAGRFNRLVRPRMKLH